MRIALIAALALVGWACSEDLDADTIEEAPEPAMGVVDNGDGTWSLVVDASADDAWVHVDLADGRIVSASDGWDLMFQRFSIGLNGGASGDGQGAAQWAEAGTLDVEEAPETGWLQDTAGAEAVERVFADWYDYDAATHTLSPKAGVWFVRAADAGAHYAVRIDSYYDAVGTAAMIAITWRPVDGPAVAGAPEPEPDAMLEPEPEPLDLPEDAVALDLGDGAVPVFVRLGASVEAVEPGAPWDLAFQRSFIMTNGGLSGDGWAGVRRGGDDYDAIETAPTVGYAVDAEVPLPGPPGAGAAAGSPVFNDPMDPWYDYDPGDHTLTPKDRAYLVRTHDGRYVRFQILAWRHSTAFVRAAPIDVAPADHVADIAAPDGWAYFSLRQGMSVDVDDRASDLRWDIATFGVRVRTNGGSSGAGMGGAYAATEVSHGDAAECVPDSMQPEPGPPGSGEFSGSPTIGAWYDYDVMTHTVTPTDTTWMVCTADGSLARVRITGYADDQISFEWRYAGPGRAAF